MEGECCVGARVRELLTAKRLSIYPSCLSQVVISVSLIVPWSRNKQDFKFVSRVNKRGFYVHLRYKTYRFVS